MGSSSVLPPCLALAACLSGCHLLLEYPLASRERAGGELGVVAADRPDRSTDASADQDRCQTISITPTADACLLPPPTNTNYGSSDICILCYYGTPSVLPSAAILKFPLDSGLAAASLTGIELELAYAETSKTCGGTQGCTSCNNLSKPGQLELRPMRSDWEEGEVTWTHRSRSRLTTWNLMTIGEGVGESAATSTYNTTDKKLIFKVSDSSLMAEFSKWWAAIGNERFVSFRVMPLGNSAVFVAAMKETGTSCQAYPKPTLRLNTCQ